MAAQNFNMILNVTKNGTTISLNKSLAVDMVASPMIQNVQTVATSAELLVVGDVSTGSPGFGYFQNLDATNNLLMALSSDFSDHFATLLPGEFAFIPLKTGVIYVKSSASTVDFIGIVTSR